MNRILRLLRMEHKEIGMNAHLHKHRSITKNKTITQIVIGKTKFSHFTNTRKTVVRGDTILQMIITTNMYSLTIGGILLVLGLQTESLIIQIGKHSIRIIFFIMLQILHSLFGRENPLNMSAILIIPPQRWGSAYGTQEPSSQEPHRSHTCCQIHLPCPQTLDQTSRPADQELPCQPECDYQKMGHWGTSHHHLHTLV